MATTTPRPATAPAPIVPPGLPLIEDFCPDLFEQKVKQHVVEAIRNGDAPLGLGREVTRDIFEWGDISHEAGARAELESFSYEGWRFPDVSKWDFRDYTLGFLHSCHAIRRGIDLWDAARKAVAA